MSQLLEGCKERNGGGGVMSQEGKDFLKLWTETGTVYALDIVLHMPLCPATACPCPRLLWLGAIVAPLPARTPPLCSSAKCLCPISTFRKVTPTFPWEIHKGTSLAPLPPQNCGRRGNRGPLGPPRLDMRKPPSGTKSLNNVGPLPEACLRFCFYFCC